MSPPVRWVISVPRAAANPEPLFVALPGLLCPCHGSLMFCSGDGATVAADHDTGLSSPSSYAKFDRASPWAFSLVSRVSREGIDSAPINEIDNDDNRERYEIRESERRHSSGT